MTADSPWAIVTPVFEDGDSFNRLCEELSRSARGVSLEIIAVDDGSLRDPPDPESIARAGFDGQVIRLKRNVGHQLAISVGLARTAADPRFAGAVIMDCDGEDSPEDVDRLIQAASSEGFSAAVAARRKRTETLFFRTFYVAFRWFFALTTNQIIRFGNFCALDRRAVLRLCAMHETGLHVAGALIKSRMPRVEVPTDRGVRYGGRSRMNFPGLVLHGIGAIAVFNDTVLTRMATACAASAVATIVAFVIMVVLKLAGNLPVWTAIAAGFLIMIFLQTGVFTLISLIVSGLGHRSPAQIEADMLSLILDCDSATAAPLRAGSRRM